MPLPATVLPTSSVEIAGETVTFRSLSRAEAMKVTTEFRGNPDSAETYILACGTGVTEAEAEAWRNSTDPETAGQLVDAIIYLTGLAKPPKDDDDAPKV